MESFADSGARPAMIPPASAIARERGVALITGCSSGLGNACARAFRGAGFEVVATARSEGDIIELRALGCETHALDVTDETSRARAVAAVEARYGAVGILVNNAGFGQYGPLEEVPLDAIRACFETNVFGLVRMAQLVLPGMRAARRGRIINVSSLAGRISVQGGGVYHMTKHAVEAIADALRPEVAPFGIDVVHVLPGPFVSRYRDRLVASIPDTGPHSPYLVFKRQLGRWMLEFLRPGRFGVMSAEHVAHAILTAATARRPRPRYHVGLHAYLGPLGRALTPDRLVDAYMRRRFNAL
jgi:NAD(P)-dependent dehydrogenase (short-subunit alcohol dehydrogenase family)